MKRNKLFFIIPVVLVFLFPIFVHAATLNLVTDKTSFAIGDTFSVIVRIDSQNTGINAAQATIQFPKDILNVVSVDKSNSVFSFWLADPTFSNDAGTVSFIGGSTSGFTGKSLEALKINFKVTGIGTATLAFTDGAVTASDGSGTNVLSLMNSLTITAVSATGSTVITPTTPVVPPPTPIVRPAVPTGKLPVSPSIEVPLYPDPNGWYNEISNFLVKWTLPNDVTDVATAVNQQPSFNPTKSEGLFNNKTFPALSDGIWYLHIRFKNDVGWGPTVHYRIAIDTAPPLQFQITADGGLDTANVAPTINYGTNDQAGPINVYSIFIDNVLATSTQETSFTLPAQSPGNHVIKVEAEDLAGNITTSNVTVHIQEKPFFYIGGLGITQFWFFVGLILILAAGVGIGWYLSRLEKLQRERRTVIAQRDVITSFDTIKKDIEALSKKLEDNVVTSTELDEMKFILKKMSENADKMSKYISENVEEING